MTKNRRRILAVTLVAVALLLFAGTALAKGPPGRVTIEGPGLDGPISITDPDTLMAFAFYMFNDLNRRIEPPGISGEGYTITRYIQTGNTEIAWDSLTYYPNPDGAGYVYFDGLLSPGSSTEGQGEWYVASVDGEAAMQRILAGAGAVGSIPGAARIVAPAVALTALLLAAALLVGGQRRERVRRSTV